MITTTLKIDDINTNTKTFTVFVGNHGYPMQLDTLFQMVSKVKHEDVTQELITFICAQRILAKSRELGIAVKNMTMNQIRSSIEIEGEI